MNLRRTKRRSKDNGPGEKLGKKKIIGMVQGASKYVRCEGQKRICGCSLSASLPSSSFGAFFVVVSLKCPILLHAGRRS